MLTTTLAERILATKKTNGKSLSTQKGIHTETVTVTPEIAAKWLESNVVNRTLSDATVSTFVLDMNTPGAWQLTEQGIAFDVDGHLVDGQHRLTAVVRSGKSVQFRVTFNAPSIKAPRDRGRGRRVGDFLYWSDGELVADGKLVATMVAQIDTLGENQFVKRCSIAKAQEMLLANERSFRWVTSLTGRNAYPSCMLAAFTFAHPIDRAQVEEFAEAYRSGANLGKGSPVLALRNACREHPRRASEKKLLMLSTFAALRAFMGKRMLDRVSHRTEALEWIRAQRATRGLDR